MFISTFCVWVEWHRYLNDVCVRALALALHTESEPVCFLSLCLSSFFWCLVNVNGRAGASAFARTLSNCARALRRFKRHSFSLYADSLNDLTIYAILCLRVFFLFSVWFSIFAVLLATGFKPSVVAVVVVVVDIVVVAVLIEMQIANAKKIYFN